VPILFRGDRLGEKVVWQMLQQYPEAFGIPGTAPHDARRTCAKFCRAAGGRTSVSQALETASGVATDMAGYQASVG